MNTCRWESRRQHPQLMKTSCPLQVIPHVHVCPSDCCLARMMVCVLAASMRGFAGMALGSDFRCQSYHCSTSVQAIFGDFKDLEELLFLYCCFLFQMPANILLSLGTVVGTARHHEIPGGLYAHCKRNQQSCVRAGGSPIMWHKQRQVEE